MKAHVVVDPKAKTVKVSLVGDSSAEDALLRLMNASASTWFVDESENLESTIDLGSINR